jgi:hypothetical protein
MQQLPTYKEQYDKIIDAYFKDEIKPLSSRFCFCGTICNGSPKWFCMPRAKHFDYLGYKGQDFVRMEKALLGTMEVTLRQINGSGVISVDGTDKGYEESLFNGMCAALEVLKKIHIERGEVIDQVPQFTKRVLVK